MFSGPTTDSGASSVEENVERRFSLACLTPLFHGMNMSLTRPSEGRMTSLKLRMKLLAWERLSYKVDTASPFRSRAGGSIYS